MIRPSDIIPNRRRSGQYRELGTFAQCTARRSLLSFRPGTQETKRRRFRSLELWPALSLNRSHRMLPTLINEALSDPEWTYETKWDGYPQCV